MTECQDDARRTEGCYKVLTRLRPARLHCDRHGWLAADKGYAFVNRRTSRSAAKNGLKPNVPSVWSTLPTGLSLPR